MYLAKIYSILKESLALRRFPVFCAAIVGSYSLLQWPFRLVFGGIRLGAFRAGTGKHRFSTTRTLVSRFFAALLSAWFSMHVMYNPKSIKARVTESKGNDTSKATRNKLELEAAGIANVAHSPEESVVVAGKTIDLTVLAVTCALDTAVVNLWRGTHPPRFVKPPHFSFFSIVSRYTDTFVFALSSGVVMWAWFYLPDRLPRAYNRWIGAVANVDSRLVKVLREARAGRLIYGRDTGHARILQSMCEEYEWPLEWGDPGKTVPIPCEVIHMGTGPSCHWHAAVRFVMTFKFALVTNLPLQLFVKATRPSLRAFRQACQEALQSSAFLGVFVALFYYGVCLSRTRLGPKSFSRDTITPMMWDSGLCVAAGCTLCGWSILIEAEKRRPELAMFVAPRALATLLPREYNAKVGLSVFNLAHQS